jgi:hypothetical protein
MLVWLVVLLSPPLEFAVSSDGSAGPDVVVAVDSDEGIVVVLAPKEMVVVFLIIINMLRRATFRRLETREGIYCYILLKKVR